MADNLGLPMRHCTSIYHIKKPVRILDKTSDFSLKNINIYPGSGATESFLAGGKATSKSAVMMFLETQLNFWEIAYQLICAE